MTSATFIENRARTDLLYLAGQERSEDLTHLLRHKKLGELMLEAALETSSLATFFEQIVNRGAVEKDLITQGAEALSSELEMLYAVLPKKINEWGDDVTIDTGLYAKNGFKAVPVPYRAYWNTKLAFEWATPLSYEGYEMRSFSMGLLSLKEVTNAKGLLELEPIVTSRLDGPLGVVAFFNLVNEELCTDYFVDQRRVTYGKNKEPISVDASNNWTFGKIDQNKGFLPSVTVLQTGIDASINSYYQARDLA